MVRFIIDGFMTPTEIVERFTFQYGQIYYALAVEALNTINAHLHSNMVRFIIESSDYTGLLSQIFTFQYGQIYYENQIKIIQL